MRTTIDFDAALLATAKARACETGITLSALVERAVRDFLEAQQSRPEPFELIEAGSPGGRCPSPAEVAELLGRDDLERLR